MPMNKYWPIPLIAIFSLSGCVPTATREDVVDTVALNIPQTNVSYDVSKDGVVLTGVIQNRSADAVCLGEPNITLYYAEVFIRKTTPTAAPYESQGYRGLGTGGATLIVLPPGGELDVSDKYKRPSRKTPYIELMGGSRLDQNELTNWEVSMRERGTYFGRITANIYRCPEKALDQMTLDPVAFIVPYDFPPSDNLGTLDVSGDVFMFR